MKKSHLIIGVILVVIIGVILIINLQGQKEDSFLFNYDSQENENQFILTPFEEAEKQGNIETSIAMSPYIDVEASITSITLEKESQYIEAGEIFRLPKDIGKIKIIKILDSGEDFDWSTLDIYESGEVEVIFSFSTRPTKIWKREGTETKEGSSGFVTYKMPPPPTFGFQEGYFIYGLNGDSNQETILLGLKEGDKFKTRIWRGSYQEITIGMYEKIS